MAERAFELWDGRIDIMCRGFREGLPWWGWKWAPSGLLTRTQIHHAGRRLGRNQDPYGLLVWRGGRRTAALYRLDLTWPPRRKTPALLASVEAMERGRRTCRRCDTVRAYRMPTSTWTCWSCMADTGDYGQPATAA